MWNIFKKQKQKPPEDLAETVPAIALFLIDDTGSGRPSPLKEFLDPKVFDYSLESLKHVDIYLDEVRKRKKQFTEDELLTVVMRCGAYCGEVIRKSAKKKFVWITYDAAILLDERLKNFDKTAYTFFILYTDPQDFSFPLAKAVKYLENGPEDSLYYFAVMVGNLNKE